MSTIARRYAQALHEQAVEDKTVERVDADVALLRDTIEGSRELSGLFGSPVVSREQKERVVRALFGAHLGETTLRFVDFLIEKGREDALPEMARAYLALRDQQEGLVEAHVRTALPMSEAEQKDVRKALEARTGKKVRLRVVEDPELIGGLVIRIGDTVYDGSVRNQLAELRERMEATPAALN